MLGKSKNPPTPPPPPPPLKSAASKTPAPPPPLKPDSKSPAGPTLKRKQTPPPPKSPQPRNQGKSKSDVSKLIPPPTPPPPPPPPPPPSKGSQGTQGTPSPSDDSSDEKSKRPSPPKSMSPPKFKVKTKSGAPRPPPLPPAPKPSKSNTKIKIISPSLKQTPSRTSLWKTPSETESDQTTPEYDVPFFQEEECSDPDDEFRFTCCVPPFYPRYPKNPRGIREWNARVLPTNVYIPTAIGNPCKRCGKKVYLAEMYLSSRGVYHTECYKCCLCGKSLDSWSMAEHKGELFCKGCYRRNFGLHGCGFGVGAGVLQTP